MGATFLFYKNMTCALLLVVISRDTRDGLVFVTKLCVTPLRQVPPTSKCASHAQAAPAQMLALSA